MISALVIDGDQILCEKTATDWLPFGLNIPASSDDHKLSVVESEEAVNSEGFISLHPTDHGQNQAKNLKAQSSDRISAAVSLDYLRARHLTVPKSASFIPFRKLIMSLPTAYYQDLSAAMQLLRWQAHTRFCSRCAAALTPHPSERALLCANCKLTHYPRIQPCVITVVTRANPQTGVTQILLAHHHRYGKPDTDPQYGLIAGFVEVGESLEQAVQREINEEVGLAVSNIRYLGSQQWPYPSNLMAAFQAEFDSGDICVELAELSHADFFDITDLPKIPSKGSIAFEIIQQVIEQDRHSV